jgi:hypothetical protein
MVFDQTLWPDALTLVWTRSPPVVAGGLGEAVYLPLCKFGPLALGFGLLLLLLPLLLVFIHVLIAAAAAAAAVALGGLWGADGALACRQDAAALALRGRSLFQVLAPACRPTWDNAPRYCDTYTAI